MSRRTDLFREALEEDRRQRQEIGELKFRLARVMEEVADRIRAGDFIRYQRLQSLLIGEECE